MKHTPSKYFWLLLAIVALSAFLRLYRLDSNPPSLYWEEVALGYDAYSILKTGKDHHGNPFPIVAFSSFGDYKPPLYFYTAVPTIAVFGLNEVGVRLPSALAGIAAVALIYLIARESKFSQTVSLVSALLLAISPWHWHFSRAAFEVNLATILFMVGVYALLRSRRQFVWFTAGVLSLVLSLYAYHGLRVLAPAYGLLWALAHWRQLWQHRLQSFLSVGLGLLICLPLLFSLGKPELNQRFAETSFFPESQAVAITNQLREQAGNSLASRIIYHRYWWWGKEIAAAYLSHFEPNFIFINGDTNLRHNTGYFGLLYHWEMFSLFAGLYVGFKLKDRRLTWILAWILLTPLAASVTKATPHALRTLPMAPALAVLSAYGLVSMVRWGSQMLIKLSLAAKKYLPFSEKQVVSWAPKVVVLTVSCVIMLEFVAYTHYYFVQYPRLTSEHWQYGYKQLIGYLETNKDDYNSVRVTMKLGRPAMYLFFFGHYDPALVQQEGKIGNLFSLEIMELLNYRFEPIRTNPAPGELAVGIAEDIQPTDKVIQTINYLDGKTAFVIYEAR